MSQVRPAVTNWQRWPRLSEDMPGKLGFLSGDAGTDETPIAFAPGAVDVAEQWIGPPEQRPNPEVA